MELQSLKVNTRSEKGRRAAGIARLAGDVPAVLYGEGKDSISLTVNARALDHVLHGAQGDHALLELTVEDDGALGGPAIVKEVQHHPVRGNVTHADFMRIDLKKKITTVVPIVLDGQSKGQVEGGVVDFQLREIEVQCLALDVPENVEIDIRDLDIGDNLHVVSLTLPSDIEILTPADRTIVAIHAPRVTKSDEEEAAEADAAAAAEGEGEGDAAAEGGDDA